MAAPVTETTGATPPGEHGPSFPPFQSESFAGQLLWFALAFGTLYVLMSRVVLPRVAAILQDRSARLSRDLEEAHRLRAESEAAAAAHEKALADARAQAQAIAQKTRGAVSAETDAKRRVIETHLAQKLAESDAFIRARTADAMGNVRAIAADAATAIVERLTGRPADRAAVEAAIDGTLRS
jgi:F-type H+-transporting ATPase subunit b